jgi:transcriptional regulator with XRE-family HTH domain
MADERQKWLREMGIRLKLARKASGLTLEKVGERLGKTRQMINHYELARGEIGAWELKAFAEMTGTKVGWLVTGESTPAVPLASLRDVATIATALKWNLVKDREALFVATFMHATKVPIRGRTSIGGFAIEAPDKGLEPEVCLNDIVVADASVMLEPNDIGVFVLLGTGETMVRRLETPFAKLPFKLGATNPLFESTRQITAEHKAWGFKVVEISRIYVPESTPVPDRPLAR